MKNSTASPRAGAAVLLAAVLACSAVSAAETADGFIKRLGIGRTRDGIAPAQLAHIQAAVKAYEKRRGPVTAKDEGPLRYPFFPQAGILGRDLFLNNFTDLNPKKDAVQDWDCTAYTYDGHQGHDSLIRSFHEQAVGVPVFAALDGVVVDAHDGEPDMNTVQNENNKANYVILDHGGGYYGWYFHFRQGSVAVSPGQAVTAGTQIGLTGSSGFSDWPHLHFETRKDNVWLEPSTGPCHPGESFWDEQPPVVRDLYVSDFFLTRGEIELPNDDSFLFDDAQRTATFVRGSQVVGLRLDLRNIPVQAGISLRLLNPKGQVAHEASGGFDNDSFYTLAYLVYSRELDLNLPGTWRVQVAVADTPVIDAPFRVVTTASQAKNRPPSRIALRLSPLRAGTGQVAVCQVQTSLITEDPDYDAVRYRYEWRVNGRLVRSVTSAALTDLLAAGLTKPRDKVICRVVPSDGRASGPAASAQIVLVP